MMLFCEKNTCDLLCNFLLVAIALYTISQSEETLMFTSLRIDFGTNLICYFYNSLHRYLKPSPI